MDMTLPGDFFTRNSTATLAGAAGITSVICNSLQAIFNFNPKWLALLVSEVISFYGNMGSGQHDYIIAILNGLLIFSTALGGTAAAAAGAEKVGLGSAVNTRRGGPMKRQFFSTWI